MTQIFVKNYRVTLCGGQVNLQEAAAIRQFPLFASILSNGKQHAKLKAKKWKAVPSALTSPPWKTRLYAQTR
jgi:iron-sulfur cluster repair protein YtfE (RIC family)